MKSKLFIVFTMVVLFISGCRSSEKKEEVVQDANNYAEYNEELETTSSNTVLSDDLLYREYSLGENFNAGEILISKETLLISQKILILLLYISMTKCSKLLVIVMMIFILI